MITTTMNHAWQGMQIHQRNFLDASRGISRALGSESSAGSGDSLLTHTVGLMTSRHGMEANLKVARASDAMLGTLIDILA